MVQALQTALDSSKGFEDFGATMSKAQDLATMTTAQMVTWLNAHEIQNVEPYDADENPHGLRDAQREAIKSGIRQDLATRFYQPRRFIRADDRSLIEYTGEDGTKLPEGANLVVIQPQDVAFAQYRRTFKRFAKDDPALFEQLARFAKLINTTVDQRFFRLKTYFRDHAKLTEIAKRGSTDDAVAKEQAAADAARSAARGTRVKVKAVGMIGIAKAIETLLAQLDVSVRAGKIFKDKALEVADLLLKARTVTGVTMAKAPEVTP
jgi:hypothetical protein